MQTLSTIDALQKTGMVIRRSDRFIIAYSKLERNKIFILLRSLDSASVGCDLGYFQNVHFPHKKTTRSFIRNCGWFLY
jgi:hypothetical protein